MSNNPAGSGNGSHGGTACAEQEPRSIRLSRGGFSTTTKIKRFACAAATDIMTERVTTKVAGGAARQLGLALRASEMEYRRGNGGELVIDDEADITIEADPLAVQERGLLEQLAAVRKERAARC